MIDPRIPGDGPTPGPGLARLLRPRSIAVVGGREAERVAEQLRRIGYPGAVWPVHPRRGHVAGFPVYGDIDALPGAPDACFVGVNRDATVDVVRQLAARGAGGAVCYASGFSESDSGGGHDRCHGHSGGAGAALQRLLLAAAGDMPIVGPNCYGLINYLDGALLWPDQHGGVRLPEGATGVAVIAQSSNLAINISMQRRGLPLAYLLTVGNQAQLGIAALADAMLDDVRVTAIGLHVEGFDDIEAFQSLALRARNLGKPLVALKVGHSQQARRATVSHTASLAGSEGASRAFLSRCGVAQVESVEALLESLKLLHLHGPLPGFEISSMSCSGGEASLMADAVSGRRLHLRALTPTQHDAVQHTLGPQVSVSNPLDYHTFIWGRREALETTFTRMLEARFDFNLLVLDFPRAERCDGADWAITADAFAAASGATGARGGLIASLPENLPEDCVASLNERGVVALGGIGHGLDAVEAAAGIGEAWSRPPPLPVWRTPDSPGARRTLDEHEAKQMLRRAGVPVPHGVRVTDAAGAVTAARALGGAVAVKALGLAHKSEHGAARLGLTTDDAVHGAACDLLALGDGVLVEAMAPPAVAELLVGVHRDPPYGLVMTLASGGVLVELVGDGVSLLLPARDDEIRRALDGLKVMRLVRGYRNAPPGDEPAALHAIHGILEFVHQHRHVIEELDVNPLLIAAAGQGAWAVDALLRIAVEDP